VIHIYVDALRAYLEYIADVDEAVAAYEEWYQWISDHARDDKNSIE
jgi:hypothetical protein